MKHYIKAVAVQGKAQGLIDDEQVTNGTTYSSEKIESEITETNDSLIEVKRDTEGYFNLKGNPSATVPFSNSAYGSFFACGVSSNKGAWVGWGIVANHNITWNVLSGTGYVTVSKDSDKMLVFTNPAGAVLSVRGIFCPHP